MKILAVAAQDTEMVAGAWLSILVGKHATNKHATVNLNLRRLVAI